MYQKGMLVYNDKAGQADVQKNLGVAVSILSEGCIELTIIKGEEPGDLEKICIELGEQAEIVYIMGGDGTVHECVNGLAKLNKPPLVAILPSGTCNDFARSLYVPLTIREAARLALKGTKKDVDIGFVNDRFFINFLGIGLITDASKNINEGIKEVTGSLSYLISALKTANEAETFRYDLTTELEQLHGEAVMIVAMNGRFIGTKELPFEELLIDDGKLTVFIVKEGGKSIFLDWIQHKSPFIRDVKSDNLLIKQSNALKIQTNEEMMADTDGEIYLRTPLNMGINSQMTFIGDFSKR